MSKNPVVLVVDDDEFVLQATTILLRVYNFDVVTANTADEALRQFQQTQPAVVLLDLWLHDRSGWEVLAEIKSVAPDVPVIICSGAPSSLDTPMGVEPDYFMPKPYGKNLPELLAKITNSLKAIDGADVDADAESTDTEQAARGTPSS